MSADKIDQTEFEKGVNSERERCAEIVMMARMGEIDNDLRSIIHRIKHGQPIDKIRADLAEYEKNRREGKPR